jgi:hypothetical protein
MIMLVAVEPGWGGNGTNSSRANGGTKFVGGSYVEKGGFGGFGGGAAGDNGGGGGGRILWW